MELVARADGDVPFGWVREDGFVVPWWHSRTGIIVKWVVFLVLFGLIMGYIVGGYLHARARLRKGLPPLAYHRCLVSRRARQPAQYQSTWPPQTASHGYYAPNAYPMHDMQAPPAYDPNRPPGYMATPLDGGSKVDPSQWRDEPTTHAPEANAAPGYQPPASTM